MILGTPFTGFTETLKNLTEWYHWTLNTLKNFYKILSDFKDHKPTTNGTKNRKDRILNNVNQLHSKYFDTYKKNTIVKI